MAPCFIERKLLPMDILHCRNRDFQLFLLLWPWLWSDDLHIAYELDPYSLQIYRMCTYDPTSRFRKLSSDGQTDKETDRQTRPKLGYTTPLRGWSVMMMMIMMMMMMISITQYVNLQRTNLGQEYTIEIYTDLSVSTLRSVKRMLTVPV